MSGETKAKMCALSETARMIGTVQTQSSGAISGHQDCQVSDVPEVQGTNPESTGYFESLYVESSRSQQVDLKVEAVFDATMALFKVVQIDASVNSSVSGSVAGTSQAALAETLILLASNDDRSASDSDPRLLSTLQSGVGYLVVVTGFDAMAEGSYTLSMDPVTTGEEPPPPAPLPGAIEVSTSTAGTPDPDGYTAVVNGHKSKPIGVNDEVRFTNLAPGSYSVELRNVDAGCTVTSANPQTVSVTSNSTRSAHFDLTCSAPAGSVQVTTNTGGSNLDSSYTVLIGGNNVGTIGPNETKTFGNIPTGSSVSVALGGIASNCSVSNNNQSVTVSSGQTTNVSFAASCSATTGSIQVTTNTTGGAPDPNGYTVTVAGSQNQSIGNNATVTFTGLAAGSHSVQLTGLAANCTVSGSNPRNVTVTAGQTAQTTFNISCPAPPGPPVISPPSYQFTVINQCGSPFDNHSSIRYTTPFTDPDGDVNGSTVRVHVSFVFSDGAVDSGYWSEPQFNSTTGDGFQGTVSNHNCLLFGPATRVWVDATIIVQDAAGNNSNSETVRVNRPQGAN